jgi:hypothetical protein
LQAIEAAAWANGGTGGLVVTTAASVRFIGGTVFLVMGVLLIKIA